jgi:predicted nucleotidyltransferase
MVPESMELDEQTRRVLARILSVLRESLEGSRCSVWLFGSRATGRSTPVSDFDLAIQAEESILRQLARARMELEESTIPFRVDLVDLQEASDALVEEVRRKGVLVWRN